MMPDLPHVGRERDIEQFIEFFEIPKKEIFENQQNPKSNHLSKPGFSYSKDFINVNPHVGYDSPKMQKEKATLKEE